MFKQFRRLGKVGYGLDLLMFNKLPSRESNDCWAFENLS